MLPRLSTTTKDIVWVAQLDGVLLSQSWYNKVYVPGGNVALVDTLPELGSSTTPAGQAPDWLTVALPPLPSASIKVFGGAPRNKLSWRKSSSLETSA